MTGAEAEQSLSPFARALLETLSGYTPLASALLKTQCARAGLRQESLEPDDLGLLTPHLVSAVVRFGSAEKGERLRQQLQELGRSSTPRSFAPALASRPSGFLGSAGSSRAAVRIPDGVTLAKLSEDVLGVLATATPFAWPILETQCKQAGADPASLQRGDLDALVPLLAKTVTRWTSVEKGDEVRRMLQLLR